MSYSKFKFETEPIKRYGAHVVGSIVVSILRTFPRFSLRLYYDQGECIVLRTFMSDIDEVQEVVKRLTVVTDGCEVSVTYKSQQCPTPDGPNCVLSRTLI